MSTKTSNSKKKNKNVKSIKLKMLSEKQPNKLVRLKQKRNKRRALNHQRRVLNSQRKA